MSRGGVAKIGEVMTYTAQQFFVGCRSMRSYLDKRCPSGNGNALVADLWMLRQ